MSRQNHPSQLDKTPTRKLKNSKQESFQSDDRELINRVSNVKNDIYGSNGERYRLSINRAHLSALEDFCRRLFDTDGLPYKTYRRKGIERVDILEMAHDIRMLPSYARIFSPKLSFPPDLDLFFKTYHEHPIKNYTHIDWEGEEVNLYLNHSANEAGFEDPEISNSVAPEHAELANDFILTIREAAKRQRLKSRMNDWLSGCKRSRVLLRDFMIKMLEEHGRLMVVDVVLLYRKTACLNREEAFERASKQQQRAEREYQAYLQGEEHHEAPSRWISLEEVKADLAHFFNNMRNKRLLFSKDKFIDYYGRIEYSQEAGYHVHICFFYNGSKVREDISYSHLIGKYWRKITAGRGYYFSCNAKAAEGRYKNVGIGTVEHDDFEKIRHLWTAVSYFVKASQIVRVKHTGKEQMVLHGKRPEFQGMKLGRPRGEGLSGPEYRAKLEEIFT